MPLISGAEFNPEMISLQHICLVMLSILESYE